MANPWEPHKETIRTLYVLKDWTLKEVMSEMKERYGFNMSKNQYERQFAKWNVRKYTKANAWKSVHRKWNSREKRGKRTAVYRNGILVQARILNKEKRHDFSTPDEHYRSAPTPRTPEGFAVCTPVAHNPPSIWVNNLPWFQLQDHLVSLVRANQNRFVHQARNELSSASHVYPNEHSIMQPDVPGGAPLTARFESAQALVIAEWEACPTDTDVADTIYDIYARLQMCKSGSNELCIQGIFECPQQSDFMQLLRSLIYMASNNMLSEKDARNMAQWVCHGGNYQIIEALLSGNLPSMKGFARTFLLEAIKASDAKFVKLLLGTGINPDLSITYLGETPLLAAAHLGRIELVQLLIQYGADVNAPLAEEDGRTVLQAACGNGDLELVQLLLQYGADVNAPPAESYGITALQAACEKGDPELVQLLLQYGADVNAPAAISCGITALQAACEKGDPELVQLLLQYGADVNAPAVESYGRTALQAACEEGDPELVQLLLQYGADVNAPPAEFYGRTALQAACRKGDPELVQLLLQYRADVNAPPAKSYGITALQAACEKGDPELVQLLLQYRADVNAPPAEFYGRTALQAACRKGDPELVQLLLQYGADVNAPPAESFGITALQGAAIAGDISIVHLLLETGAHVNTAAARAGGRTAIEGASEHGRLDIVQLLLNVGADISGLEAFHLARGEGHDAVVGLLEKYIARD